MEIYVGNLSYDTDEGAVESVFSEHGQVDRVQIIMDKFTGRSKGFGFVTMPVTEEGNAAIEALDGVELDGRAVKVNEARPREERPRFGGGGGGGGDRRGGGGPRGGGDRRGGGGGGYGGRGGRGGGGRR
jgi:RNA recognition motif-containing protein